MKLGVLLGLGVGLSAVGPALAGPGDAYDFVTIGALNNPPLQTNNPNDRGNGHGSVSYEYRIGRTEVTTQQWVDLMNAAFARPQSEWVPYLNPDVKQWAARETTPTVPGGRRWTVAPSTPTAP